MSAQLWRACLSIASVQSQSVSASLVRPSRLKRSPAGHDRIPRRQNSPDRWSIPPTHATGSTPDPIVQARGGAAAAVGFLAVGRLDSAKPQGSAYRIRTGPCTLGEERAQEWEPARQSPLTASGPRTRPESGLVQSSTVRRRRHASPAAHRLHANLPGSSRGIGGPPRAARTGCASGSCSGARQAWNTAKDASRNSADNALAKTQRQARGPKQTGSGPGDERTGRRTRCCARFSCRRSVSRLRLCAGTFRKVTKLSPGETVTATARCRSRGPAAPASPAG